MVTGHRCLLHFTRQDGGYGLGSGLLSGTPEGWKFDSWNYNHCAPVQSIKHLKQGTMGEFIVMPLGVNIDFSAKIVPKIQLEGS